jgi:hypothetical protein
MAGASSRETAKNRCSFLRFEDVTERKRAEETLRTYTEEISRLTRGVVRRELRIIEVKKEVNELCHRLGEVGRYPLEFEQDGKERPDCRDRGINHEFL